MYGGVVLFVTVGLVLLKGWAAALKVAFLITVVTGCFPVSIGPGSSPCVLDGVDAAVPLLRYRWQFLAADVFQLIILIDDHNAAVVSL